MNECKGKKRNIKSDNRVMQIKAQQTFFTERVLKQFRFMRICLSSFLVSLLLLVRRTRSSIAQEIEWECLLLETISSKQICDVSQRRADGMASRQIEISDNFSNK